MKRAALLPFLPLLACGPPDFDYTDQWGSTREICGWEAWEGLRFALWRDELGCEEPAYPSKACVDAVLADLHVDDLDPFLEAANEADPYAMVRGECPQETSPAIDRLLWAGRLLFTLDLGEVSALHSSDLVSQSYIDILQEVTQESGVSSVNAALYNLVTTVFEETRPTDPGVKNPAQYDEHPRALLINLEPSRAGIIDLEVLVHEQRHAWNYDHLPCRNPYLGETCDETPDGSYGFAIATYVQFYRNHPEVWDENRLFLDSRLHKQLIRVFTYLDELGRLEDEWEEPNLDVL